MKINQVTRFLATLLLSLIPARITHAEVALPGVLASDMVIQRDRPVTIWGWAGQGEKVTIELGGKVVATTTGQGKQVAWKVQLPPQKAGPVPDIRVAGSTNSITLTNVLAGEVWLCAGQSNMAMTTDGSGPGKRIGAVLNAEQEVRLGDHPEIRFFTAINGGSPKPAVNASGAWTVCSPKTVGAASAVAYFFGRSLQERLSIPVGLVIAANAATAAELWIDPKVVQGDPEFTPLLDRDRSLRQSHGVLFNGKIHPLASMAISGVIWYQGESNGGRAPQYRHCLTKLIESWRQAFGQPFPFLIVQLAKIGAPVVEGSPFGCWPLVREAQMQVATTVTNCGIATAVDVGDTRNLHPPNKQEVGRRLALVALKQVYGQTLVASGPRFDHAQFEKGKAIVCFQKEGADQLVLRGPGGFAVAGQDRRFTGATAIVKGNTVEVSAPSVPEPVAVRYAFLLGPETPLFNGEGLPAFPFRSDDWNINKDH